ncbi:MAG: hypothetical protein HKO64_01495 [Xanthomonadales bacterium]|nr:MAPEG family protein [Gammaproteobacteria bacterium]NNE04834.1 hypothetical protein [Xanthomonadales bacterium]NNL94273.1 hypothetical protein [Xanthomonadales bacterium]
MFYKPLLLPLMIQVLLTFVVWHRMYFDRISEMQDKRIDPQRINTREKGRALLTGSAASADNFSNQFEMPVLFYLAIVLALMLLIQDAVLVVLAWSYVVLRIVHSFIHTTYNHVMHRFWVYIGSCAVLMIMWVRLAWQVL